jgi:hypothetical protein
MSPWSTPGSRRPFTVVARLRPLVVAIAAVVLAAGNISPAIALSPAAVRAAGPVPVTAVAAGIAGVAGAPIALDARSLSASAASSAPLALAAGATGATGSARVAATHRVEALHPQPATGSAATRAPKTTAATSFTGRNHLWIPALGIDRGTSSFACSRSQAPANYVYRWGCAGSNNVYLMGHAYGVFKALHDAYYNGRLKVGLIAVYADGSGNVHTYRVAWWRVVRPTTDAKWAWAPLATPSMTLQTCLGANSQTRLMVRLVRVS